MPMLVIDVFILQSLPTCGDTNPTTNPGTPYNCSAVAPAGTWFYDMSANKTVNPNVTVCCKVRSIQCRGILLVSQLQCAVAN